MSEAAVERMAMVTKATLQAWEATHDDWLPGRFRNDHQRQEAVSRLANVYAALMWLGGGCEWPRYLEDEPLRAAVERMRMAELPPRKTAS
jgi:hypothetical protein